MIQTLSIAPLTSQVFAPFGQVVEADPATMRLINGGTTERYHALATAEAYGDGAEVILSIFRGQPRKFPYAVSMMERHPFGSQSFQPLSQRPYLVVVAMDDGGKPNRPLVFMARSDQGINYRANVWHHPLMALGDTSDFLVVDRQGQGHNLEEYYFNDPYLITEVAP
jgi:ureidoglycolate lyase